MYTGERGDGRRYPFAVSPPLEVDAVAATMMFDSARLGRKIDRLVILCTYAGSYTLAWDVNCISAKYKNSVLCKNVE